ncbi:MAG: serine protease [Clostridia bacterium]|nr:serine protease [Clostridia bacterium]
MKKLISFVLAVCLLPMALAAGFGADVAAINKACESVMRLEILDADENVISYSSGFVAFDSGLLVTALESLRGASALRAVSDTGENYNISGVLCLDEVSGIAILRLDGETGLTPLVIETEQQVYRASPVVAIASPQGFTNNVSSGNVTRVYVQDEVNYIGFNAPVSAGSPGGALLNDDGRVIGVIVPNAGAGQNMNAAVSAKYAHELYAAHASDVPVPVGEAAGAVKDGKEAVRTFTILNDAPFSISEVYLYAYGAASWGKARNVSGWLYKGESMEFTVTDEEAALRALWTLNFCFYYNSRPYYIDYTGISLSEILGHTLRLTMDEGRNIHLDIEDQ